MFNLFMNVFDIFLTDPKIRVCHSFAIERPPQTIKIKYKFMLFLMSFDLMLLVNLVHLKE